LLLSHLPAGLRKCRKTNQAYEQFREKQTRKLI